MKIKIIKESSNRYRMDRETPTQSRMDVPQVSKDTTAPRTTPKRDPNAKLKADLADGLQNSLAILGLFPGGGEPFDLANAGISMLRGDELGAVLNLVSTVPTVGDILGKGTQALIAAVNNGINYVKIAGNTYSIAELASYLLDTYNDNIDKFKKIPGTDILKRKLEDISFDL